MKCCRIFSFEEIGTELSAENNDGFWLAILWNIYLIRIQCTLSLPPENIRKRYVREPFQEVEKGCIGN